MRSANQLVVCGDHFYLVECNMKNVLVSLTDAALSVPFRISRLTDQLHEKVAPTSRSKAIFQVSSGVTFAVLMMASGSVFAQTQGLAGMAQTAADQADAVRLTAGKICMFLGLGGGLFGISKLVQKGKEGENSHVKAGHIVIPIVGGVLLGALGAVMAKVGQSVGLQSTDYGSIPGS
jgi:hypothetical protein